MNFYFLLILIVAVSARNYCGQWQEIRPGDTCWGMIHGKDVSLYELKQMNKGLDCDKLYVGEKLCLAMARSQSSCRTDHKIRPGDTCFNIWTSNGLSQMQFMDWNPNVDCDRLQIGKHVCIMRF
uniref:LysM domain-containing protein n=1 Tax=Caenorhabditis tropicalis TaxID=1561998 RepID=A0A1I7V2B3_9PELO